MIRIYSSNYFIAIYQTINAEPTMLNCLSKLPNPDSYREAVYHSFLIFACPDERSGSRESSKKKLSKERLLLTKRCRV
jgi:hypothetical protein